MGSVAERLEFPDRFVVEAWQGPAGGIGFPVKSLYTEAVLLPILGPSATLCLRRLGAWASARPNGFQVDAAQLARDLGLGDGLGRNAAMPRTLTRLCQFDMARWADGRMAVRTVVPPLAERHLQRLSPELVKVHQAMLHRQVAEVRSRPFISASPAAPMMAPSAGVEMGL